MAGFQREIKVVIRYLNVVENFQLEAMMFEVRMEQLRRTFNFHVIRDSWDDEFIYIKIDGVEVWSQKWTLQTGSGNICGVGTWSDHIQYVEFIVTHSSPNLNLQLLSNLDEDAEFESWGFRDFKLFIEPGNQCAILYTQVQFQGTTFLLCSSKANFDQEKIPSQIKSIRVPPQGKVTLYSNSDYFGKKYIFIQDTPELNEDLYSFIEVEQRQIEAQNM